MTGWQRDKKTGRRKAGQGLHRAEDPSRPVQAGPERDGWVDILAGVKEGEKGIVEGNLHLIKFFKTVPAQPKQPAQ